MDSGSHDILHLHSMQLQYDKNYALFKLQVPIDYAQVKEPTCML